jgi:hypothetical protein
MHIGLASNLPLCYSWLSRVQLSGYPALPLQCRLHTPSPHSYIPGRCLRLETYSVYSIALLLLLLLLLLCNSPAAAAAAGVRRLDRARIC